MNVALFTDADAFAGTEKHLLDLSLALRELDSKERNAAENASGIASGISTVLVCPDPSPLATRAHDAAIPVIAIPAASQSGFLSWKTVRLLRRHLRSGRFQILHAHNGRTALHAVLATLLARRGHVVVTQHFLEPAHTAHQGPKAKLFGLAHHWVNARVAHFITISEAARQRMLARQEAPPERIAMVHNALFSPDTSTLAPAAEVRARLGAGTGTPLVVCVARLEKEKSLDTLIEAMALLRDRNISAHGVIAGEGEERANLEAQIEARGVTDRVSLPGYCSDVLSLIRAGDIFVLPSQVESFGLVLLEAMALEKPVIATRIGGPAEVVGEDAGGVLVPPGDAPALAAALERLLSDAALRACLGRAGRARYETHFQPERMAHETAAVYRQVVSGAR